MSITRIAEWLKEHGVSHNEATTFTFDVKDEPWMDFNAELQDWSHAGDGHEVLFIGYYFEQGGDICHDSQLRIELRNGEVTLISHLNWMTGASDVTDDPYASEFVDLVWQRHFDMRVNSHETMRQQADRVNWVEEGF